MALINLNRSKPYEHQDYPKYARVPGDKTKEREVFSAEEEAAAYAEWGYVPPKPIPKGSTHSDQILKLHQFLVDKLADQMRDEETTVDCAIRLLTEAMAPASTVETVEYADGTTATGVAPLPDTSPDGAVRRGPGRPPKAPQ